MSENKNPLVLVTGGSGFIAVHIILKLLQKGFHVRTTLRTMSRQDEVKAMLKSGGVTNFSGLSFIQTDLSSDKNWGEAVKGAEYVIHVASPTPNKIYKNENEMIQPAREGVLRVLSAARDADVKRVVLTSAFGAIGVGHHNHKGPFTEEDWSNINAKIHPYQKSKTIAEQSAWEFIRKEGNGLELAAVNPVGVMGPILGNDYSHSNDSVRRMLEGKLKYVPKIYSDYVDVRDVADLHILAMLRPEANGERFIASSSENISMLEVANILKKHLGDDAINVPKGELPNILVRMLAIFNPKLRMIASLLGLDMSTSNQKAKRILGWRPRSAEESIAATGKSMLKIMKGQMK
ncbi:SDR family oxidoreductase [Paenibacillus radicis (ex Gao et al. 2016)]|uniref:Nucleoside-diphosphate sugar epimerase n=1 Tax=Paenibacillus radicis (ex Gao et al. 2016) TaxID=1737354 RepID=A0A917GV56_9BACL|nr:aldehyde reductase [Paenibacillus radicis (ex Gao et al. 2016)]GGG57940.1 nucleoside-diphosphate sugar epimerase [Paenibacillus radicis (ex Gao et al. 2016)]